MIFFKIFVLIIYLLTLKMYYRQRKNPYMEDRKKYMDWFYIFYTIGITFYIFEFVKLAMILYCVALCFQFRSSFTGTVYENFKEWEKTANISKMEKILVILSLKYNFDFEEFCFKKDMEEIRKKLFGFKE